MKELKWLVGMLLLASLFSACGGTTSRGTSPGGGDDEPQPAIRSFLPSSFYPKIGKTVSFTWEIENPDGLPCDFDFDGDGVADRTVASCPATGSIDYSYRRAGKVTAVMSLGSITDSLDITVESIQISAFYWALNAIADCDTGLAGGGEFGWDLSINGVSVAFAGPSDAVLLNDGETYYFTGAGKYFEITDTAQEVRFHGVIYEYDSAGQLELYLDEKFGEADNWGILPTGRFWRKVWDVEPGCKVELLYAVREQP